MMVSRQDALTGLCIDGIQDNQIIYIGPTVPVGGVAGGNFH